MILGKIRIYNIKSIIDTGYVYLQKGDLITILAGQNESGKTAFLRALRFFEEGPYDGFEEEDKRPNGSPRVECTFYLTNQEYEDLKKETNKKLADFFKKNGITFVRGNVNDDDFNSIKYIASDDLKSVVSEFNEPLKEKSDDESGDDVNEFDVYNYFDLIRPRFVFYSSFSDSILPGKIKYGELSSNQAVQDFEQVYNVDFQELLSNSTTDQEREDEEERIKNEAGDSLNSYWNQVISGEEVQYKFLISARINTTNPSEGYVTFYIKQGREPALKISQKSQGFQWFSGFILRLRAHQSELDEQGIILLIDEPGQGLHEQAQEDVKNVLEELATRIQIIYSTHQPILIGGENLQFSRLLLVDKTDGSGSKFKSISQLISSNGSKDALSPIKSALGLINIRNISNRKLNVIVEGITEYFYFKTIFGSNYSIIPSVGVDNVKNIFSILYGWGLQTKALVDNDVQGRRVFNKIKNDLFPIQQDDISEYVYKIDGNGIENLLSVSTISNILEMFNKVYDNSLSKIDNIEKIGKVIFAKSFYDMYNGRINSLDEETKNNFSSVKRFLDGR